MGLALHLLLQVLLAHPIVAILGNRLQNLAIAIRADLVEIDFAEVFLPQLIESPAFLEGTIQDILNRDQLVGILLESRVSKLLDEVRVTGSVEDTTFLPRTIGCVTGTLTAEVPEDLECIQLDDLLALLVLR